MKAGDVQPEGRDPRRATRFRGWTIGVLAALAATGSGAAAPRELSLSEVPAPMRSCFACHPMTVSEYLRSHGMARSLGPAGELRDGTVVNPRSGVRYELSAEDARLTATFPDGGRRVQRLVGRIGAGIFDTSWVGAEVDVHGGEVSGRLFFAPVETVTDHGLELSPFDLEAPSPGLDMELTEACLTCHTDSDLGGLPGAAGGDGHVFPANSLGAGAFDQLQAIGCDGCHGDPAAHLAIVPRSPFGDVGMVRLADLPAGAQRDVCARCHLQGDVRIDLAETRPAPGGPPLAGRIPVLVPKTRDGRLAEAPADDLRFVGQLERLALSACFRGSPDMTCTSCHLPHRGVRLQGTPSFDRACAGCHACVPEPDLAVEQVTGKPARTDHGCVDCHVRRSQPFDLPHVSSADHFIRRRIPRPREIPYRPFADRKGALAIYDDGRLATLLAEPAGRRWRSGIHAMGLLTLGRLEEAAALFDAFPPPGTEAARSASAPDGLAALETRPDFHQMRALALLATGRLEAAAAAFSDALELDPSSPGALMGRARLRFDRGDVAGAVVDTQAVIVRYPRAEQPWRLRAEIAERLRRPELALEAHDAFTRRWPSDAVAWTKLGLLLRQRGDEERARAALARARILRPSLKLTAVPAARPE